MEKNEKKIDLLLLDWKQVMSLTGLCRGTIQREIDAGKFPKPVKLSDRVMRFKFEEIKNWRDELK